MTLYAWAARRRFPALPPPEARHFAVSHDTQVLAHCHWQADRGAALTVILLHGLEGSSESHYMRGMAEKAWRRGFNVVRLNQRNCGGTEHLTPGLYHSGLSADPLAVLRLLSADGLERFAVCGYSLGGNIALKLGRTADAAAAAHRGRHGRVTTHRTESVRGRAERAENAAYHLNFLVGLRGRMKRKATLFPDVDDTRPLARVRSVRRFEDLYTAPHNGFAGAADYYHRASAAGSSSVSPCRRCSSPPTTIRSCRPTRRAIRRSALSMR
jgi:hypothetical protein